jgi:DNA mismatch endonuclease (patch repair protein)
MTDIVDSATRSRMMGRIRSRNTLPERQVRSFLFMHGFRFRLHVRNLPGSPDIVLPALRTAIFVHGCFWHRHPGCRYATKPATRRDFWENKLSENVARDKHKKMELEALGWNVLVIWECQTTDSAVMNGLVSSLGELRHSVGKHVKPRGRATG